jgi:hypothetical protein
MVWHTTDGIRDISPPDNPDYRPVALTCQYLFHDSPHILPLLWKKRTKQWKRCYFKNFPWKHTESPMKFYTRESSNHQFWWSSVCGCKWEKPPFPHTGHAMTQFIRLRQCPIFTLFKIERKKWILHNFSLFGFSTLKKWAVNHATNFLLTTSQILSITYYSLLGR